MGICIFGSLNMDLVVQAPRLPKPGETLSGSKFETIPGGKGANQAVAAARLGSQAHLFGRVGGDGFGQQSISSLRSQGVVCDDIAIDDSTHTGIASIIVASNGANQIVLAAGANGQVGEVDIDRLQNKLPGMSALLLQLEIPIDIAIAAAKAAQAAGVNVILDPAPAPIQFPLEFYRLIDILTPNQTEAEQLLGVEIHTIDDAIQAAQQFRQKGVQRVVLTLGEQGIVVADEQGVIHWPSYPTTVVDTTAAGDAFNGAVAAALDRQHPWTTALQWGLAAGALTVSRSGAQPSLPSQTELFRFLQSLP
ncbi:MAG: ribokinase [Acaryochloridaceae cyanobacterium RU_4_10]|nr:ribokinase [Acaryochloridaceae cyanobacterium RU_4_10]